MASRGPVTLYVSFFLSVWPFLSCASFCACFNAGTAVAGFPRSREQAADLGSKGVVPDLIVMLERPDELVKEFSLGRCTDPTTGVIYHPKVSREPKRVRCSGPKVAQSRRQAP